jgi:peptide/nickel transport system substrate-binding protein
LKPLGINLTVKGVPAANVFAGWTSTPADTPCNTTHGNFDVVEFAWVASPDPGANATLYQTKFIPDKGDHAGQNYIRVSKPEVDDAMNTVLTTVDITKIKDAMDTFQKIYTDPAQAFPEIPLYNWTTVMLKNPKLHNIANNGTSSEQIWNLEDWWRDQ